MSRNETRRALVAMASAKIPADKRADIARQAFELLENDGSRINKTLAIDALANCSDGVDDVMRKRLREMLDDPPAGGLKARLLGCLQQLGATDGISLETSSYIARTVNPTTATWRALAEQGPAAEGALIALLETSVSGVDRDDVVAHFARHAPKVVIKWLDNNDEFLQMRALNGLRAADASSVESSRLADLLTDDHWVS